VFDNTRFGGISILIKILKNVEGVFADLAKSHPLYSRYTLLFFFKGIIH